MPLYILGLMGATRRLNHYETSTGWHPLFVLAGVGIAIIILGGFLQLLVIIIGVIQRKWNGVDGDPWNARTLEWSTASPPPFYNFAIIPKVKDHDPFWVMKQMPHFEVEKPQYEDIHMPKNTPIGMYIGVLAFLFGFGMIWYIWWLAAVGLLGIITCMAIRLTDDDTDYYVPAAEVERIENENAKRMKHA